MRFREAVADDLPAVVALLADDTLGRERETGSVDDSYRRAFAAIDADPRSLIVVAEDAGEIVACVQVTYISYLSRHGAERCQLEGIRVRADRRGSGLGRALLGHVIEQARVRGCSLVQLTSDKARVDALRFYRSLGFVASHEGLKLQL